MRAAKIGIRKKDSFTGYKMSILSLNPIVCICDYVIRVSGSDSRV